MLKTKVKELRICTDGKVTKMMKKANYYDDQNHQSGTSCFGKYVAADQIPYIVVPPSKAMYKFSVGVIINTSNNNYLYCVVAEVGPEEKGMGEVSIYAAWKMRGINPPKKLPKDSQEMDRYMIGNKNQTGNWKIILFKKSSPKPKQKNKKYGWKYKNTASRFRRQIKKEGSKCYTGKGKCLN